MKKIFIISVVILAVWGCSKKVTPTSSAVTTSTDSITTVIVEKASPETLAAGEATFKARCGRCHHLKDPAKYTATKWASILRRMAVKAKLSDIEKQNVLAYLQTNAKQ